MAVITEPSPDPAPRTLNATIERRYRCASERARRTVDAMPQLPAEKLLSIARIYLDAAHERGSDAA